MKLQSEILFAPQDGVAPEDDRGINYWISEAQSKHKSPKEIATVISVLSSAFESDLSKIQQAEEDRIRQAEAEGWTVVKRKNPLNCLVSPQPSAKRAKRSKENPNFYAFQSKASKQDQLTRLREQFQKDREKIKKMKESRQFNPL